MRVAMTARSLHLNLQASAVVPSTLNWRVEDGHLRLVTSEAQGPWLTLALWGPGDLVIPSLITMTPMPLLALAVARVVEAQPERQEREAFLVDQILQTSTLLRLSRTRPAEQRRLQLLLWIGQRFGRVSSRGVSLSFGDMNLTHRILAQISGLTRVKVTKAMSRFREEGWLIKDGVDDLLLKEALASLQQPAPWGGGT